MKNLILHYGSSSAVEVLEYILENKNEFTNQKIYIHDDNSDFIKSKELLSLSSNLVFVEKFNDLKKIRNSYSLITIGDPMLRDEKYRNLKKNDFKMWSFIHPTCLITKSSRIGEGCIIGPFAVLATKSKVKDNCIINSFSLCGHHSIVGKSSILSPRCSLLGGSVIGNRVLIGTGAVLMQKVKIASDCKVSSNSVVLKSVKIKSLLHGNPAKKFKL